MTDKIQLGATYTDVITGFKGVAIGYVKYLTGCNQALITPRVGTDGVAKESHWYDEQRLKIDTLQDPIVLDNGKTPGFDKPAPTRR